MKAHILGRRALGLMVCGTFLAASCSLLRTQVTSNLPLDTPAAAPAQLAQVGFGRQATFAHCVHPACPVRTPKTLAPESPDQSIDHESVHSPAESVSSAPIPQNSAPKAESSRTVVVQFGLASAKLSTTAQAQLNDAKSDLRLARRITIFGRTDSTGPLAFNEELALARALAVRDYLRQTHLTLAAKLTLKAQGACCFIASNDTVAGRTQNRRVEVVVHRSEEDPP